MKKKNIGICLPVAEGKKQEKWTALVPETVPALFLLFGILFAFRDMMYGAGCLAGALFAGSLVTLALQISELSAKVSQAVKMGIYVVSILSFLGFILYVSQGFLYTVNRFMVLWNMRFHTELDQFSVDGRVVMGSVVFWCLLSVLLSFLLLILMKRRSAGIILALVIAALFTGFVLGRLEMWMSVLCLLFGIFGMLIFSAAPGRQNGIRGLLCMALVGVLFLAFLLATGGYQGLAQIARWRAGTVAWFEKFRYGEDTLPKGDLRKAQGLLEGEEETLILHTEEPQEWYLKGFVGAVYNKTAWQDLPMDAYHGEYEGLLQWLETKGFSAITQYAGYNKLAEAQEGFDLGSVQVEVENTGAYRKFLYLPSSVENWSGSSSEEKKDWQVRSKKFFGAKAYAFQAVKEAATADEVVLGAWVQNPSGEEEENYLGAESVYRSFAEDYYMDVDDQLKEQIEELFFPERLELEMDFNSVTKQIRRTLRQETQYTEKPSAMPDSVDFVQWFLNQAKRGNAVHYASAAVLAYRTAGYAARYVEGYHYTEEEAQKLLKEGADTAVLTNKNAHAWAEVYIPQLGWLPVEVVPGMYTEQYTNQIVEGAPSYQVNPNPSEDGLGIEEGMSGKDEQEEMSAIPEPLASRDVLSILLLCLYACFVLYLALEFQRVLRRKIRKGNAVENEAPEFMERYVTELERLLLIGKVAGSYDHPMELSVQVEEKLTGISREEYERVVRLIQKVRFGGKQLLPYEFHALNCFEEKLVNILSQKKGVWSRIKVRYWYALV